jgi:hypothetical protein
MSVIPQINPGVELTKERELLPELISEALSVKELPALSPLLGPLER